MVGNLYCFQPRLRLFQRVAPAGSMAPAAIIIHSVNKRRIWPPRLCCIFLISLSGFKLYMCGDVWGDQWRKFQGGAEWRSTWFRNNVLPTFFSKHLIDRFSQRQNISCSYPEHLLFPVRLVCKIIPSQIHQTVLTNWLCFNLSLLYVTLCEVGLMRTWSSVFVTISIWGMSGCAMSVWWFVSLQYK